MSDGDAETRLSEALVSSHSPKILPRISKDVRDKKRERGMEGRRPPATVVAVLGFPSQAVSFGCRTQRSTT